MPESIIPSKLLNPHPVRRSVLLIILALMLGAGATWLSYHHLKKQEAEAIAAVRNSQKTATTSVVVASRSLEAGTVVESALFAARAIPRDLVYDDAILVSDFDAVKGMRLINSLQQGRPLLRSFLEEGGYRGFSDRVTPGRRAMTINVDEVSSIHGMARPNDRLDFFLTLQTGGRLEVVPLLSSIRILATGSRESEAPPDANNSAMLHYATMTLDVSPEEAETLVFARSKGQLTAVLRNRADQAPFKVESITDESIHAGSALSDVISLFADHGAKAGHTASPRTVEFILGGNRNGIPTVTTQIVEEGAAHTAPRSRSGRVMDVPRETQEPQPFVLPAPIIVPDPNACIGDDCQ